MRSIAFMFLLVAGCSHPAHVNVAVHGDSTAIASRIPLSEKFWNLAPSLDRSRWWNILRNSYSPPLTIYDDGVKGQSLKGLLARLSSSPSSDFVILYDRMNSEESAPDYERTLQQIVPALHNSRFLIVPQVDRDRRMALVNEFVATHWPGNTFPPNETAQFEADLSPADTRVDGIHRNAKGQMIEVRYIRHWLDEKHWLS